MSLAITPNAKNAVIALVVTGLAACGSTAHSATPALHTKPPVPHATRTPVPRPSKTPTTVAGWERQACADFHTFLSDLETDTPHDLRVLRPDADRMLHDVIGAGEAQTSSGQSLSMALFNDANNLQRYVWSSSWDHQGNIWSKPVLRMERDCPQ